MRRAQYARDCRMRCAGAIRDNQTAAELQMDVEEHQERSRDSLDNWYERQTNASLQCSLRHAFRYSHIPTMTLYSRRDQEC